MEQWIATLVPLNSNNKVSKKHELMTKENVKIVTVPYQDAVGS